MNEQARTCPAGNAAGFSLIEVMISVVLLAVAMLAIGAAQLRSLQFSAESSHRSQAMYLAEEQMNAFMAMPANDGALFQVGQIQDGSNPIILSEDNAVADNAAGTGNDTPFYRSWTVVAGPGALRTITVQVRWNIDPNDPRQLTVSNLRMVQLQGVR